MTDYRSEKEEFSVKADIHIGRVRTYAHCASIKEARLKLAEAHKNKPGVDWRIVRKRTVTEYVD